MILAIFAILLTLILVVGVHEAGHGLAARLLGVKIQKISIGFGRPLVEWRSKSGLQWIWALWPLGGYAQLLDTRHTEVKPEDYPLCYDQQKPWRRFIILSAGILANLLTALSLLCLIQLVGMQKLPPQIATVKPGSLAARAGLMPGDRFLAINNHPTVSWTEVNMGLILNLNQPSVRLSVQTANQIKKTIILALGQPDVKGHDFSILDYLGLSPDLTVPPVLVKADSWPEALKLSFQEVGFVFYFFLVMLELLVTGVLPFSLLLGPLAMFTFSIQALHQGLLVFLMLISYFSISVALFNSLPIPGLDAGGMLYLLLEKIRGRPLSLAWELLLFRLAFIAFALLLIQLLLNDLARFIH